MKQTLGIGSDRKHVRTGEVENLQKRRELRAVLLALCGVSGCFFLTE